jgi:hypothetical protein
VIDFKPDITLVGHDTYRMVDRLLERILKWYPDFKPKHWTEILEKADELGLSDSNDTQGEK